MRKRIIGEGEQEMPTEVSEDWLDLEQLAMVELTSEDPAYPIESAFKIDSGPGWRADKPGKQTIRLLFDQPHRINRIHLLFQEKEQTRTQEFVLIWYPDHGDSGREIVRQQYNFSPAGNSHELEDYNVNLDSVVRLELTIIPDISGGASHATLAELWLA